ncbi:MAG: serine protease, partial [Patescibacteria group bacterium]
GYSISKEDVKDDSEIKLIWYNDGWDDKYPATLDWKVSYPDEKINKIRNYDSRGIIETTSISDDPNEFGKLKVVKIKVGYFDLLDEFKPKTQEIENLNKEIETLKNQINRWKEEDEKRKAEEPKSKRDISNVTWSDVRMGTVKAEELWIYSAASGIFLGNMKTKDKMWGSQWGRRYLIEDKTMGVVLTNAHVSQMASTLEVYVSEDKEIMWIVFPGWPSVRYTQDSDQYGSPAPALIINDQYVHSMDYDCGILVTSAVPQYEKNKAILGDSDKVNEGDSVIMVGNPMLAQKFMTEGIVANKNYTMLKSALTDRYLGAKWFDRSWFNWLLNSNWWFDAPIGIDGTSGSGVWAMEGSERGKVVALHNMGLISRTASKNIFLSESKEMDFDKFGILNDDKYQIKLKDFAEEYKDKLFKKDGFKSEKFSKTLDDFDDGLTLEIMQHTGYYDISGMNAGIPINGIKRFLQERGLDPEHFGFEGAKKEYWEK